MRISDWSSDVCSSDLEDGGGRADENHRQEQRPVAKAHDQAEEVDRQQEIEPERLRMLDQPAERRADGGIHYPGQDRQSVGQGKSVSVSVDLGGGRLLKKKTKQNIRQRQKK